LTLVAASSSARAGDIVLNCYLFQSGSGASAQFVRRVDVDTQAGTVAIADDTNRTGFKAIGVYGKVVTADDDSIVFDFSSSRSSGRTTIDRHAGTYAYTDGRIVLRGSCSPSNF
jgi:hypothetical protein